MKVSGESAGGRLRLQTEKIEKYLILEFEAVR